jgi:glycosyltransferase involved in cell wall biosynthesis
LAKICFYTNELAPVTRGGIGSLIWDALHILLAQGHAVTILADIRDEEALQRFRVDHAPSLPGPGTLALYGQFELLPELAAKEEHFATPDLFRSFVAKECLVHLAEARGERFDLIEFMDVWGPAYYSLVEKKIGCHFQSTILAVRNHGTLEHWHAYEAFPKLSFQMYIAARMEQFCVRHADLVLCASETWAQVCRGRFGLPRDRIVVSPPSLVARDLPQPAPAADSAPVILCHGKLEQRKGVEILVDAAVSLFASGDAPIDLIVVFTGGDMSMAPEPGRYREYLYKRIPLALRDRFQFTGHVPRATLGELLARTLFGVIPSRVESYGYAAHELYAAGIPLIVADIPAFADAFADGGNCLKFDGSATDLRRQMKRLLKDDALRAALKRPYAIEDSQPGSAYSRSRAPESRATPAARVDRVTVLVLSAAADKEIESPTLTSITHGEPVEVVAWILSPWTPDDNGAPVWLRGKPWIPRGADGRRAAPDEIILGPAVIMLAAGDEVDSRFLPTACNVLSTQPDAGMIACWHSREAEWGSAPLRALASRFPWELVPEMAPLGRGGLMSRAVFRAPAGITVDQWVDDRWGAFTDISLAWRLLEDGMSLYSIPEEWVRCAPDDASALRLTLEDVGRLSVMFDHQRHEWLQQRLPQLTNLVLQAAAADAGPITLERLGLVPHSWRLPEPPPTSGGGARHEEVVFYGKKWLLRQFWRELCASPMPGPLKRIMRKGSTGRQE